MILAAGLRFGGAAAKIEATCQLCREPEDESADERAERLALRASWGCDEPTETEQLALDCWVCPPKRPRAACRTCGGSGTVQLFRCPWSQVDAAALQICDALPLLDLGLLPTPGGWADQAATWYDATVLALQERATYEEIERERQKRKAERQARRR